MNKTLLLRLHRWIALAFSAPLLGVILTGLILSFEPIITGRAIAPGSVTAQSIEDLLRRHDPQGAARSIFLRPTEGRIMLGGVRRGEALEVDLRTGEEVTKRGGTLSDAFVLSRRIHELLLLPGGWLVTASTVAMLALAGLGPLMGWPRFRNTLAGWHRGLGWLPLPLLVISPLTGLMLALGITLAPSRPSPRPEPPLPLGDAIRILGTDHDIARLSWIRPLGGGLVARLYESGEMKTYAVTRAGAVAQSRNWPRLIHEGTWGGVWLPLLNVAASLAMMGLLSTGFFLWARRKLRRSSRLGGAWPRRAAGASRTASRRETP